MDVSLRFGNAEHAELVADNILRAGGGLFEYLLDGVLPLVRAVDLLKLAIMDEGSALHFSNAVFAEHRSTPVGMILCYASDYFTIPTIVETLVPRGRLDVVRDMLSTRVDDSLYVNSLVVDEEARGRGVAQLLLQFAGELATKHGLSALSLHAWAENAPALRLYGGLGFNTVQSFPIAPTAGLAVASRTMLLLKATLPLPVQQPAAVGRA